MSPALALYLAATARVEPFLQGRFRRRAADVQGTPIDGHARPATTWAKHDGSEVLWIHLARPDGRQGAELVAARLVADRPGLRVIATFDGPPLPQLPGGLNWVPPPIDAPRSVEAFLADWRPDAALWIGAPIRPALAAKARRAGLRMILADAGTDAADSFRGVPAPDLLAQFTHVFAESPSAAASIRSLLRRAGGNVEVGHLQRSVLPPPCDQTARAAFAAALKARSVWLALGVDAGEVAAVREAHAAAQRGSHRLLLILRPADDAESRAAVRAFADMGLGVPCRSGTLLPSEGAAMFVADLPDEDGLWLHLAPVTFIGGTLAGHGPAVDPFAPASLGSAVLYGPRVGDMAPNFHALAEADSALPVASAEELGAAVSELQAPDRAATLAARAWDVVSEGAETTDRIVGLLCDIFDEVDA